MKPKAGHPHGSTEVAPQTRLLIFAEGARPGQAGEAVWEAASGHGSAETPALGGEGGTLMAGKKLAAHEDLGESSFLNVDLQFFKQ